MASYIDLSGDYTVEGWISSTGSGNPGSTYWESLGTYSSGFWSWPGFSLSYLNSGNFVAHFYVNGNYDYNVSFNISGFYGDPNFHHVAMVKHGSTGTVYVNGVSAGSVTGVQNLPAILASPIRLGYNINGNMDEFRISDIARYLANFTPQTLPFPSLYSADAHTMLLLHGDGLDGGSVIVDSGTNSVAITQVDTGTSTNIVQTVAAQSKFGGTSLGFNEEGNAYAQCGLGFPTIPLPADFTLEAWIYPLYPTLTNGSCIFFIDSIGTNDQILLQGNSLGSITMYAGSSVFASATGVISAGTWSHIAIVRTGTTITCYVNGASVVTGTCSSTVHVSYIGNFPSDSYNFAYAGYMDEIRISDIARYTSPFSPPNRPFASAPPQSTSATGTSLLLHCDGSNGGTTFIDSSEHALAIQCSNVTTSTTHSKFGGASAYFPTGNGYLGLPANAGLTLDGDYTIECWYYMSQSTDNYIFGSQSCYGSYIDSGYWRLYTNVDASHYIQCSGGFTYNVWHHLAITKQGSTLRMFLDGVMKTLTNGGTPGSDTVNLSSGQIGMCPLITGNTGAPRYIDEFRIVKGQALYTGDFTPLNTPYTSPAASNTLEPTQIGKLLTKTGLVSIADNGIDVMMVDGTAGYWVSMTDPSPILTQVTSDNFKPADTVTFQDGYFILNQNNSSYYFISDLYSHDFLPLNEANKSGSPDQLVGVVCNNRELYLFGKNTTEMWWNSGQSGSTPFARQDGKFSQIGCIAPGSIARLFNTVMWVGSTPEGGAVVYQMQNDQPVRVSNHAVEFAIQSLGNLAGSIAYTWQIEGHYFYALNCTNSNTTWIYDLATGQWTEQQSNINGKTGRHLANTHCVYEGNHIVGDYTNGNVYLYDFNVYTDNGNPIVRMRQSPHIANRQCRVFYKLLQIDFTPGTGLANGDSNAIDPRVTLEISNDGGENWSMPIFASVGRIGNFLQRARWQRLGSSRDRVFRVTCSDPIKFDILSCVLDIELGES